MFRSADGAGICHMYLCGITPTPEIAAVGKTALGAEESTRWDYASNGVFRAEELLKQGCRLWALEQDRRSISITDLDLPADGGKPLILVVGNEVCGVDPGILERCEQIVHIPMQGGKRSLNVAVAFGIAAFALRELKNPGRS
jgi:23S rRNA (guanosine2251-2'-O)-methyltransferase